MQSNQPRGQQWLFLIEGIPAVLLFKDGKMVDQVVGLVDKGTLKQMVDRHL